MASSRKPNVSDMDLHYRILVDIWEKGEVIESDLYPLSGAKNRIRPILDNLCESGILVTRTKEKGQKVPVYFFTEKGRLYCMSNMFSAMLRCDRGELSLEDDGMADLYDNLSRQLRVTGR